MTLRKLTLLVVGCTLLGLIAVVAIALEITLIRHFNAVEEQAIDQDLQRGRSAISSSIAALETAAKGLAWRDDTYQFTSAQPDAVRPAILNDEVFKDLKINLVMVVGEDGRLLAGKAFDLQTGLALPVPVALSAGQTPLKMLAQPSGNSEIVTGIIALQQSPLLVLSYPVRAIGQNAPARGRLIVGRLLDENEVQRLGAMVRLPMSVVAYGDRSAAAGFQSARTLLTSEEEIYTSIDNEDTISAYALMTDLEGKPVYLLRVEQPRTIYRNGRFIMNYLIGVLMLAGVVFGSLMLIVLERMALSRLFRLNQEVSQIGETGELDRRVTETKGDELTHLSRGINFMLDRLEALQLDERRRVSDLDALYGASQEFLSQNEEAGVLNSACRLAVQRFGLDAAWIGLLDEEGVEIHPAASSGIALDQVRPLKMTWDTGPAENVAVEAVRTKATAVRAKAGNGDSFASAAALPLISEGEAAGVISLFKRSVNFFTPENEQLFHSFGNLAGMAYQNARLIDKLKAGRKRLQALSRRLVEVQEEERRSIALELHDEVGQILTGLKLLLDSATAVSVGFPVGRRQQASEMVNDLIGRVRQMSLDLRPAMLDDLGLLPALLWLFGRYTSQTGVAVNVQHSEIEDRRFPTEYEITAYRVVQEGLTNVARYARVTDVMVRLWNSNGFIGIQVEDSGAGFDPEAVFAGGNSRGLVGIRERATSLGGRLSIASLPGHGTCLTVELPLAGFMERRKNAR